MYIHIYVYMREPPTYNLPFHYHGTGNVMRPLNLRFVPQIIICQSWEKIESAQYNKYFMPYGMPTKV